MSPSSQQKLLHLNDEQLKVQRPKMFLIGVKKIRQGGRGTVN